MLFPCSVLLHLSVLQILSGSSLQSIVLSPLLCSDALAGPHIVGKVQISGVCPDTLILYSCSCCEWTLPCSLPGGSFPKSCVSNSPSFKIYPEAESVLSFICIPISSVPAIRLWGLSTLHYNCENMWMFQGLEGVKEEERLKWNVFEIAVFCFQLCHHLVLFKLGCSLSALNKGFGSRKMVLRFKILKRDQ